MEQVPTPVSPNNNMTDASAISFSWTGVAKATDYELAVSTEPDFASTELSLRTGPTNVLTLYEMLPEDGRTLYWKVRALSASTWSGWSKSVSFVAGSVEQVVARARATRAGAAKTMAPKRRSTVPERPLALTTEFGTVDGSTSLGQAVAFAIVMVGSFALLMILLMNV